MSTVVFTLASFSMVAAMARIVPLKGGPSADWGASGDTSALIFWYSSCSLRE